MKFIFLLLVINHSLFASGFKEDGESPRIIIHGDMETNIKTLSRTRSGESKISPWSGDYHALQHGGISFRHNDESVMRLMLETNKTAPLEPWFVLNTQFQEKTTMDYLSSGNINSLSPAEKYDLLIGDTDLNLTKAFWNYGKGNYYIYKKEKTKWKWMGFCDGWSHSSIYSPRPNKSVTVLAKDNETKITFYPSDIKGLLAILWSHGESSHTFTRVGRKCELYKNQIPEKNLETQKEKKYKNCYDVNPGSFHLAVLNQVGLLGKSFVYERNFDYEVWNHPIKSFKYNYVSQKKKNFLSKIFRKNSTTNTLEDALIPIEESDPNKRELRSVDAKWIVQVNLEVIATIETYANSRKTDSQKFDKYVKDKFQYDLELDKDFNIIGGEWISKNHPDYIGGAYKSVPTIKSPEYKALNGASWDGVSLVPDIYLKVAKGYEKDGIKRRGISDRKVPHSDIVLKLLEMAQ